MLVLRFRLLERQPAQPLVVQLALAPPLLAHRILEVDVLQSVLGFFNRRLLFLPFWHSKVISAGKVVWLLLLEVAVANTLVEIGKEI